MGDAAGAHGHSDGMARRLVLARHGETAWNAEGRFQGQANPPLNDRGRAQARRLAAEVAAFEPGILVSSDLLRARQTADVVATACRVKLTTDPALREVDLGKWEGLRPEEVARRFPDEYHQWVGGADVRRGGGETEAEAGRRAVDFLDRLLQRSPAASVVVVAHGLMLQRAMDLLADEGRIDLDGVAPHLGNGEWIDLSLC